MRPVFYCRIFCSALFVCLSFAKTLAQPNMFRGNPEHNINFNTDPANIFGEAAWKFEAGAPIRATVVCNNKSIFFGSSKGIMYALNKSGGNLQWQYHTGFAIESSAALYKGNLFFSDNRQSLYSLNAVNGKLNWEIDFGENRSYDWGFDYFYSSPTIINDKIIIGAKDGYVYNVNAADGKINWKFKTAGIVRCTPAISANLVYFGDTDGILYAVDLFKGKEVWRFFTFGHGLKNEDFGFDRRAIISSPIILKEKLIVGCRDGLFYAVNKVSGKELWRVDHKVSWVISSIAVKDSIAVTGTSDGRFVQAVNINTGKEIWKQPTISIVWSSPVICNNQVYIGSQEGNLYCLDLLTGKKINTFRAKGKIFSSPVISDNLLFFGTDMGLLYALKPAQNIFPASVDTQKYVFWEPETNIYFHYGNDIKIRDYLHYNQYTVIHAKELAQLLTKTDSAANSVIVFASNYFPEEIQNGGKGSLLRAYLNSGGRIVVLGNNPVTYKLDQNKQIEGFSYLRADSILDINYGPEDLRSVGGLQPAFATEEGNKWGIAGAWTGFLPLDPAQVDIVLGKDENGKASAWVKKFSPLKGSGFIQVWVDPDQVDDLEAILRVAGHGMGQ